MTESENIETKKKKKKKEYEEEEKKKEKEDKEEEEVEDEEKEEEGDGEEKKRVFKMKAKDILIKPTTLCLGIHPSYSLLQKLCSSFNYTKALS